MPSKRWAIPFFAAVVLCVAGCGGGGSNPGSPSPTPIPTPSPTPQPPAPFILNLGASEVAVAPGGTAAFLLQTIVGPGSTNYNLQFSVTGLPAGITASFSPNPAPVGTQVSLAFSAAASAPLTQNVITSVVATRSLDGTKQSAALLLDVAPPVGHRPNSRSDFIHTDGSMLQRDGVATGGVLDLAHHLLFVTDANFNRVQAISTTTNTVVKNIPVPQPWGLDLSTDGTKLFVGTGTPQLFVIDTASLLIVKQYSLPLGQLQQRNFVGTTAIPAQMANGKMLIVALDPNSTSSSFLEWDLNTNIVTLPITDATFSPAFMVKGGDGARAVVGGDVSPSSVKLYDSATDSFTITLPFPSSGSVPLAASPDSKQFIIADGVNGVLAYDANLHPLFGLRAGTLGGILNGVVYSPDGTKIYYTLDVDGIFTFMPNVVTASTVNGSVLGVAPAIPLLTPGITRAPPFIVATPLAADDTGLVYGISDHGVAVDDAAFVQAFVPGMFSPEFGKELTPNVAPLNSSVHLTFSQLDLSLIPDVWFGSKRGNNPATGAIFLTVDAPPSAQPGPVNVKLIAPDGTQVFYASGFTYGPHIMYLTSSAGASSGGATAHIVGLGLPSDPSQIGVTIGNQPATVVNSTFLHYGPFPTQDVQITLPPGSPGVADLKLTTPAGTATLPNAYQFVDIQDFAEANSPQAVLFDRFRNRVYVSAGDHVDVFSPASRSFAAPLPMPVVSGVAKAGPLALTPDGKKLLVGNFGDGSLAVIDPDNPVNRQAVSLFHAGTFPTCVIGPRTIAPTSAGTVVIRIGATPDFPLCLGDGLDLLNLTTLQSTGPTLPLGCGVEDVFADSAGDTVLLAGSAYCTYTAATDTWSVGPALTISDLTNRPVARAAISGDGNVSVAHSLFVNSQGVPTGVFAPPDIFYSNLLPFFANLFDLDRRKLNDSGSLLYIPYSPSFVDVFDVKHGQQQLRVGLKEQLPNVWDNLTVNTAGDQIFVITNVGLTMIQLSTAPLAIGSITPSTATAGTSIKVRGSGFTPGSIVTFNGSPAVVTFVDSSTLSVVVPVVPAGPQQISINNSAGTTYSLDNALTVQ